MNDASKRWGRGALALILSVSMATGGVPAQALAEAVPPQGEVTVEPAGDGGGTAGGAVSVDQAPAQENTEEPELVVQGADESADEPALTAQDVIDDNCAAIVGTDRYVDAAAAFSALFGGSGSGETPDELTLTLTKDVTIETRKTMGSSTNAASESGSPGAGESQVRTRTIDLNGHTITFDGEGDCAISVLSGHLIIKDSDVSGKGAIVGGGVSVGITADGFRPNGDVATLEMRSGTIQNAKADGVRVGSYGSFTMGKGTISGSKGYGVRVQGVTSPSTQSSTNIVPAFKQQGGSITGNGLGGVYVGKFTHNSGTRGASFEQSGGTIGGTITDSITGSEVSGNKGNGVSAVDGYFKQISGTIENNEGDGVSVDSSQTTELHGQFIQIGGTIQKNGGNGVSLFKDGTFEQRTGTTAGTIADNTGYGVYADGTDNKMGRDVQIGGTVKGNGKSGVYAKSVNGKAIRIKIDGATISGNGVGEGFDGDGGGVYAGQYTILTISGSKILGNKATNGAGVYAQTSCDVIIGYKQGRTTEGNTITNNVATGDGGGVYVQAMPTDIDVIIRKNTISGNRAQNGAGVYMNTPAESTPSHIKARIQGNTIGVPSRNTNDSSTSQESEKLTGNVATGNGGGVCIVARSSGDEITIRDNTVSGNEAANGAGVHVAGTKGSFDGQATYTEIFLADNTITKNAAKAIGVAGDSGGNGGGLYAASCMVYLHSVQSGETISEEGQKDAISANEAANGAGVYLDGGRFNTMDYVGIIVGHADIIDNKATGNGGGIYLHGNVDDTVSNQDLSASDGAIIVNAAIQVTGNSAKAGGGIFIDGAAVTLSNSITGNTASDQGAGVYYAAKGKLAVWGNVSVYNNKKVEGEGTSKTETESNVFLGDGKTIALLDVLAEASKIGVTAQATPTAKQDVQLTTDYKAKNNNTPFPHFFSDAKHNNVYVGWYGSEENEAALKLHVHGQSTAWQYRQGDGVVEAWCTENAEPDHVLDQEACSVTEESPLALKLTVKDKTYDGKPATATVEDNCDGQWKDGARAQSVNLAAPGAVRYYQGGKELPSAPKDAGKYTAKAVVAVGGTDYVASCDFTIAPAPLAVTARDKAVSFGDAPANGGVAYDGLVGGETEQALSGTLAYDYAGYRAGSPAGSYRITPSGLTSGNYAITFKPGTLTVNGPREVTTTYSAHVQGIGDTDPVHDGAEAGTTGSSRRVESIRASVENQPYAGDLEYRGHVQGIGWEAGWAKNGELSGTTGQSKRVEAIQMRLTGDMGRNYDVFYRVHAQTLGWLGWAKNGEPAGTSAMSRRVEAYEVLVLRKGETPEGYDAAGAAFVSTPAGRAHVQGLGWVGRSGTSFGTTGSSRRVEAFALGLSGLPWDGGISYQSHVQGIGWQGWRSDGALSGTTGKSKRVEAVRISLSGEASEHLDVWYRVHSQTFGWLGWARNGESAGTAGYSKRSEAVEVQLLPKGATPAGYDASQAAYRTR